MPIGESLRRARTERELTLDDASEAIKIRVRYLRALEAEDWDAMPGRAYAFGFLRTYASYLGLDADPLVEELRRSIGEDEQIVEERRAPVAGPGPGTFPSRGMLVAAGAVVAVLAVVFIVSQNDSGGEKTATTGRAVSQHDRNAQKHRSKPKPLPEPTRASIEINPTGTVWVCLVDLSGQRLVNGQILAAGDSQGPFKAAGFELGLGNSEAKITANGKPLDVPSSPNPLAFHVGPTEAKAVSPGKRPLCA
jgi:hypothetical protein